MSLASKLAQHYVGKALTHRLEAEFEEWKRSKQPIGEYALARAPRVAEILNDRDLGATLDGLRRRGALTDRLPLLRERSKTALSRAEALAVRAENARKRLEKVESLSGDLERQRAALVEVRAEASDRVATLVDEAGSETDRAVAAARMRLEQVEARAAAHVEEVERRARITERSIIANAEAAFARNEARLITELDRARLEATAATELADAAMEDARREADDLSDSAAAAATVTVDDAERRSSVLESIADLAANRSGKAAQGHRRESAASNRMADLESMGADELYERAQKADVRGRSRMNKAELIQALRSTG